MSTTYSYECEKFAETDEGWAKIYSIIHPTPEILVADEGVELSLDTPSAEELELQEKLAKEKEITLKVGAFALTEDFQTDEQWRQDMAQRHALSTQSWAVQRREAYFPTVK